VAAKGEPCRAQPSFQGPAEATPDGGVVSGAADGQAPVGRETAAVARRRE
jgi:hypothetical protein